MTKSCQGDILMLRCLLRSATAVVAGGLLVLSIIAVPAWAESGPSGQAPQEEQKSSDKDKEKDKDKAEADRKSDDQVKAEEEAKARAIEEYREAAAKLPRAAGAAECVWAGRRIASLLWRDDIDTANRYIDLYERFGCSSEHLKVAFRCVVQQGPLDPKAADRLASRVHGCWIAPSDATQTSSQATTGTTAKDGTIPN
jgi:hypothetical protein